MIFFIGFAMRARWIEWLENEESNHKTASDLKKTECQRCGLCCLRAPCIPTKDEFIKIVKFLKLSKEETIKKYFVCNAKESGGTKFLAPARSDQLDITGTYISFDRTYDRGYCIFYDKEKKICKIHEAKPKVARETECWTDDEIDSKDAIDSWKGIDLENDFGIDMSNDD